MECVADALLLAILKLPQSKDKSRALQRLMLRVGIYRSRWCADG